MKQYVVDTTSIHGNLALIKELAGQAMVIAVLKGDGYGLGLQTMAGLCRLDGIHAFAVTEPEDVLALRRSGDPSELILMLRPTNDKEELKELILSGAVCTVSSSKDAMTLSSMAVSLGVTAKAHIKVDTGMGRYGFLPNDEDKILACYSLPSLQICGIYTHFHSSFCNKKATFRQAELLQKIADNILASGFEPGLVHCANSSALLRYPELAMGAVRVGSAILGRLAFRTKLHRVGFCQTTVEEIRWLPKGATTGYGAAYKAKKAVKIAVLPVGWYHGYTTEIGNDVFRRRDSLLRLFSALKQMIIPPRLTVQIGGKKCPVLGHVGMLHTTVNITNADVREGDLAVMEINPTRIRGMKIKLV